jgi:hypothetical protein
MIRSLSLALFFSLFGVSTLNAAPALTSLFPAGGQRGTTVEVTATGTFDSWPVKAWASSPLIEVTAGKEKGKLKIAIKPETPPGLYRLRLYDDTGASQLRPFLVGLHPDVIEVEPNDEPAKAQAIKGPASIHGKLAKNGDVDCYSIRAKKGETLVASLDAHTPLRSPIDAVLQIVSPENAVVAENHDYRGLDPQAVYAVLADGTYIVRVFAFPSTPDSTIRHFGSDLSVYRLTITTGPFVDYATPFAVCECDEETEFTLYGWNLKEKTSRQVPFPTRREPHDCFDFTIVKPSKPLEPPFTLTGRLNERESVYEFDGRKGQALVLKLESASMGFPLNPVVLIQGPDGKQLSRSEAAKLNSDLDVSITLPAEGVYRMVIRDLGQSFGPRYAYRIRMIPAGPQLDATVTTDRFTLTPDKPLDIPIPLARLRFTDAVDFSIAGLPEDVTAERSIPAGKDDPKAMTIRLTTKTAAFSGPIRIAVFGKKDAKPTCFATAALAEFETTTDDLWLTVLPKK